MENSASTRSIVEGNQPWAKAAPVLALGCTNLRFACNDKPNAAAVHDLGLASANPWVMGIAGGMVTSFGNMTNAA